MPQSPYKTKCLYALAVTLLAIGVFAQAVRAKHCDYVPNAAQAVRFSTTVKIADLADHVVVSAPDTISIARGVLPLMRPQSTHTAYVPEIPVREISAQISFRPLRSPPEKS
jgi:hypothetical protein